MSYLHASTHTRSNSLSIHQRRGTGIVFAILVHLGLLLAIGSGLTVTGVFREPPPVIVRHIEPTKVIPPARTPIDNNIFTKPFSITDATPPIVETKSDESGGLDETHTSKLNITGGNGAVIEARVDPHHPLTQPAYPPVSRRLGEQGTVELGLYILADGTIGEVRIEQSSGYARLDEAARQHALRSWRLLPQQTGGIATASWQHIAITFRLKN